MSTEFLVGNECQILYFLAAEELSKADKSLLNKLVRSRLVTTKNDLEILQKDPNSPLYSVKSFEALHL